MAQEKSAGTQQKDKATKTLEYFPDVFADISNVLLFKDEVIREDQLRDGPTESIYKADDGNKNRSQYRDVAKYVENCGIQMLFVGVENQVKVDSDMAIRMMGYDYAAYRSQVDRGNHRFPVISCVLYFGQADWNGAKTLAEIVNLPEAFADVFCDYRINLIDVKCIPRETRERLTSDFKLIADYFAEPKTFPETHGDVKMDHPAEVMEFFRVFTGDERFAEMRAFVAEAEKEGRDVHVCEMVDMLEKKGRVKLLIELVKAGDLTIEKAAAKLNMPEEEFRRMMEKD